MTLKVQSNNKSAELQLNAFMDSEIVFSKFVNTNIYPQRGVVYKVDSSSFEVEKIVDDLEEDIILAICPVKNIHVENREHLKSIVAQCQRQGWEIDGGFEFPEHEVVSANAA